MVNEQMPERDDTIGRVAFDAYVTTVGGKTYDGKAIPLWKDLFEAKRNAWCVAAWAAVAYFVDQKGSGA